MGIFGAYVALKTTGAAVRATRGVAGGLLNRGTKKRAKKRRKKRSRKRRNGW